MDFADAVDRPYGQRPATRAAALAYLERTGNADVAAALGLIDAPDPVEGLTYKVVNGRLYCLSCGNRTRSDGVCRRTACGGGWR